MTPPAPQQTRAPPELGDEANVLKAPLDADAWRKYIGAMPEAVARDADACTDGDSLDRELGDDLGDEPPAAVHPARQERESELAETLEAAKLRVQAARENARQMGNTNSIAGTLKFAA